MSRSEGSEESLSPSLSVIIFDGTNGEVGTSPLAGYIGDYNFVMENFPPTFSSRLKILVLLNVKYMSWLFCNILYIKTSRICRS